MNKCQQNFLNRLQSFQIKPISKWDQNQLLGYLLDKTEQTINLDATWENTNCQSPSRNRDLECVRNIYRLYFDKDPVRTKAFIDFCLAERGKKLRANAFRFLIEKYQTEHKIDPNKITNINRTDPLPTSIKQAFNNIFSTYGDLAFAYHSPQYKQQIIDTLPTINMTEEQIQRIV